MIIEKRSEHGSDPAYSLTELLPAEYEAILNGLELLAQQHGIKSGLVANNMLLKLQKYEGSRPQSIKGAAK